MYFDIDGLFGETAADCLKRRQLFAFAAKPKGRFWASYASFERAAAKEFKWFGKAKADPDWAAIFAAIQQLIEAISAGK